MWKVFAFVMCIGMAMGASSRAGTAADGISFAELFEDADLLKRGWYDGDRFRIVGEARDGRGCIEYEWVDRNSRVSGSSPVRRLIEPTDEVFVRFYVRLSKGWGWSGKGFHPHLIHFLTTENARFAGPAATHLTLYIEPVDGKLRLAAQDIQNKDAPHGLTQGPLRGGYNGKLYDSRQRLFDDDRWHCIEAQFKLNTLNLKNDRPNADGIVRGWFDGELVIEQTDVVLRSTDFPRMKFNQFLMAPYFGPGLLPHAQKLWIDELAVGTRRIGPLPDQARPAAGRQSVRPLPQTRPTGMKFIPADVDWERPIYQTSFDDPAALAYWKLEGGLRMSVANGNLILESKPGLTKSEEDANHLVCWLKKEIPADFLLEFTVRPRNRKQGLNIVFFNARGVRGENIFDPKLKPRDGLFQQYHSGDLNCYHISYWAAGRGTANVRKNFGFHLVAEGKDLVSNGPADAFQTIHIYKRGGVIRCMVDDLVSVAYDDDGQTFGPTWTHSGWIGLRQMGHTVRCEYGHLKIWPLKAPVASAPQ